MQGKLLILGASGMLGAPVARRLKADGFDIRAMSRDPEKARERLGGEMEIVEGDIEDSAGLEVAMEGCDAIYMSLQGDLDHFFEARAAEKICEVASRRKISRIGAISGCTVAEENRWHPMIEGKYRTEQILERSGIPFTLFRCTWFMESLPFYVRGNNAMVMGKFPFPYNWIAADDYAGMVSKAFSTDEARNKRFVIHGPESLTMKQALEKYCAICAPEAKVKSVPLWMLRIIAFLTRNDFLKFGIGIMDYFSKVPQMGDPKEANALLGAPITTLETWCQGRLPAS